MTQQGFGHFGGGHGGGSVDPNELLSSSYGGFSNSYAPSSNNNTSNTYGSGGALFGDDELLDSLGSPAEQPGMHGHGEYGGMNDMGVGFNQGVYNSHQGGSGVPIEQHVNGYSNTPEGEPIHSPYVHSFGGSNFRQVHHPIQSPMSGYSGSPLAASEVNPDDPNYLKARAQLSQSMQRKSSNTRSPMTPKSNTIHPNFGPQPIRTSGITDKSPSGQWMPTPGGSIASYNSGFSSPIQHGMVQINEVMMKGGTSMPAKLPVAQNAVSSQEMKRKRRRESHNLVERRRRDNINERIQDLSRLVPAHRLEDEKIRKMIQNGTPLSPTLGVPSPNQATSGLAGPGARRAAGSTGNITTGLPMEEKDKGPNKGDILNGSVSWTRDLMWMLHLKLQQQEELMNCIADLGGQFPFELTDDEKRMQTELMEAMTKNDGIGFGYSRTAGSGLRVPQHTDYRGQSVSSNRGSGDNSLSPEAGNVGLGDMGETAQFWHDPDVDDRVGDNSMHFKEEDEYDMDLTN